MMKDSDFTKDFRSDLSHVELTKENNFLTLSFVENTGEKSIESIINLASPFELLASYMQIMALSLLFGRQEKILLLGLGGGAMVHFLRHHFPQIRIDIVEIDPLIVRIADQYFNIRNGEKTQIFTTDGADFLQKTHSKYDAVYIDAFLNESPKTDSSGAPLHLRSSAFYEQLQKKLRPQGLAVVNFTSYEGTERDLETMRAAFPQVFIFRIFNPSTKKPSNVVVFGFLQTTEDRPEDLLKRAKKLDRIKANFSFERLLRTSFHHEP